MFFMQYFFLPNAVFTFNTVYLWEVCTPQVPSSQTFFFYFLMLKHSGEWLVSRDYEKIRLILIFYFSLFFFGKNFSSHKSKVEPF